MADAPTDETTHIKVSKSTHALLSAVRTRIGADSLDDTIVVLLQLYGAATGEALTVTLRDLSVGVDRLATMVRFLAASNLDIASCLRRIEAGRFARLSDHADSLEARILATRLPPASAPKPS